MGVEQPACLVALAAAAVPLLLHLRSRRAVRSVQFPNVELLRRVARDVRRERVLAGAWLLAARASVVALARELLLQGQENDAGRRNVEILSNGNRNRFQIAVAFRCHQDIV